jgi:hypothetical protein
MKAVAFRGTNQIAIEERPVPAPRALASTPANSSRRTKPSMPAWAISASSPRSALAERNACAG